MRCLKNNNKIFNEPTSQARRGDGENTPRGAGGGGGHRAGRQRAMRTLLPPPPLRRTAPQELVPGGPGPPRQPTRPGRRGWETPLPSLANGVRPGADAPSHPVSPPGIETGPSGGPAPWRRAAARSREGGTRPPPSPAGRPAASLASPRGPKR